MKKNLPIDQAMIFLLSDKENGFVFPSSEEATLNSLMHLLVLFIFLLIK